MKNKFNIKLLLFFCSLIFLILAIISICFTYARYITSLKTTSTVEMGSWLILVNNQNIMENSNVSNVITPVFNEDPASNTVSEYIAVGKIAPTSTGYVEIALDYSEVTVPFKYDISFSLDDSNFPEELKESFKNDFKLVSYSVDGGESITFGDSDSTISATISPDETTRTRTLKLNFAWFDGEGESLTDANDTLFSRSVTELGLRFNLEFTQLEPTT